MKLFFSVAGLLLVMSVSAQAHRANVMIKHADKVVVKTGIPEKKIKGMIYCLNSLKKHATATEATAAAMTQINEHCAALNMDAEYCAKKQKKVARYIHFCYEKADFFREYVTPKSDS